MAQETYTPDHTTDAPAHDEHAHHDDRFVFMGKTYDMPVYTAVFIVLGILTLIEVAIAELTDAFFTAPSLLIIGLLKAGLVMYYYMHLKDDTRLFAISIILPIVVALLSLMFLLAVPPSGY